MDNLRLPGNVCAHEWPSGLPARPPGELSGKGADSQRLWLVVVLYGRIGCRKGRYYHRPPIAGYLEGLAAHFDRMTVVARTQDVSATEPRLVTELSPSTMQVAAIRGGGWSRLRGVFLAMAGFWNALKWVRRASRSGYRPVLLTFAPGPLAVGVALASLVGRFRLGTYFGLDWSGERSPEQGSGYSKIRRLRNRLFEVLIAKRSDTAICAGRALFEKVHPHCDDCVETVPILALRRSFAPEEGKGSAQVEQSMRSEERSFRFLYVGTLTERKGVSNLISALAALRRQGVAARLRIVGSGPMFESLKELSREVAVEDDVEFSGHVADARKLAQIYAECDTLVLPSRNEGFGRVLYEAALSGLPIVASSVGGAHFLLEEGVNALLVPPGDLRKLAAAMKALYSDVDLRRRMSRANVVLGERVVQNDPVEQHAKILRSVALGD